MYISSDSYCCVITCGQHIRHFVSTAQQRGHHDGHHHYKFMTHNNRIWGWHKWQSWGPIFRYLATRSPWWTDHYEILTLHKWICCNNRWWAVAMNFVQSSRIWHLRPPWWIEHTHVVRHMRCLTWMTFANLVCKPYLQHHNENSVAVCSHGLCTSFISLI